MGAKPRSTIPVGTKYDKSLTKEIDGSYGPQQHFKALQHRVATVFDAKLRQLQKEIARGQAKPDDYVVLAIGGGRIRGRAFGATTFRTPGRYGDEHIVNA